jgi:hypothetical protein
MDIGDQKRVIIVEPIREPSRTPTPSPRPR